MIPKTVKVGAYEYKIQYVDSIDGGKNDGECDHENLTINIDNSIVKKPQRFKEVLLHEITHMIEHCYNVDLGEKRVISLGLALADLFTNNKKLMRCLIETTRKRRA